MVAKPGMVEEVAEAIWLSRGLKWREAPQTLQELAREEARAAIRAMREPSEAMADAGQREYGHAPSVIWRAMIDAALASAGANQPLGSNAVGPSDAPIWHNPSRNSLCHCGSRKKYKHCHGRLGYPTRSSAGGDHDERRCDLRAPAQVTG